MTIPPWAVVTSDQLKYGYVEKRDGKYLRREYFIIKKLQDGKYAVRNPILIAAEDPASPQTKDETR